MIKFERLKLMPDYGCSGLWGKTANQEIIDHVDNIEGIGLSKELVKKINSWQKIYSDQLNIDDPCDESNTLSEEEKEDFDKEGRKIYSELKKELKHTVSKFYYYSIVTNKVE